MKWFLALVILAFADSVITVAILARGGVELNPLVAPWAGPISLWVKGVAIGVLAVWVARSDYPPAKMGAKVATVLYGLALIANMKVLVSL